MMFSIDHNNDGDWCHETMMHASFLPAKLSEVCLLFTMTRSHARLNPPAAAVKSFIGGVLILHRWGTLRGSGTGATVQAAG